MLGIIGETEMDNKFDFYEIVEVISSEKKHSEINGFEGIILGMAQNNDGSWGYTVDIKDDGWDIDEKYLVSTGKFSSRDQFYSDSDEDKIGIIVDKNGEGKIKDE